MRRALSALTFLLSLSGGSALPARAAEPAVSNEASPSESASEEARITYLAASVDVDDTPYDGREDFKPASLGMKVPAGSIIRTGKNALCEVTMPDGSQLRIASGSVVRIDSVDMNGKTG